MNLPNRLTVLRVLMVPFCVAFIMLGWYLPAAIVFGLAALTDLLDGHIARRDNLVTNFGRFADPVADKVLVLTVMIALLARGHYYWWAAVIVAARELTVDGLRLIAVEQGVVVPAGKLGKYKTNAQIFSLLSSMLFLPAWLRLALAAVMCALTLVSGWQYFSGTRGMLKNK